MALRVIFVGAFLTIILISNRAFAAHGREARAPVPDAVSTPRPARAIQVTEQIMLREPPLCARGCVGLAEWSSLVADRRLLVGLILAYHYNDAWRPSAKAAALKATTIIASPLPDGTHGAYYPARNIIAINASLIGESAGLLAAVLAHEIVHAASLSMRANTREGAGECLHEEMTAFSWTARTRDQLRERSLPSAMTRSYDGLVEAWRGGRLREVVLLSPHYQQQCLGRQLPRF